MPATRRRTYLEVEAEPVVKYGLPIDPRGTLLTKTMSHFKVGNDDAFVSKCPESYADLGIFAAHSTIPESNPPTTRNTSCRMAMNPPPSKGTR